MKNLKIKISKIILLFLSVIIVFSCSKKDNEPVPATIQTINDCGSKNYGVVTVNFAILVEKHAIDITNTSTNALKSKIVNIGIASDTIHLKPGNYNISTVTVNNAGLATGQQQNFNNRQVTQCSTQIINATN